MNFRKSRPCIADHPAAQKLMRDHEADRIVVDDRQPLTETGQPGGKVSAAASQNKYAFDR